MKQKNDQVRTAIELIYEIENKGIKVRKIRCDNAGENQTLKKECEKRRMNIIFEFTSPGTPQQNGKVERSFSTNESNVKWSKTQRCRQIRTLGRMCKFGD